MLAGVIARAALCAALCAVLCTAQLDTDRSEQLEPEGGSEAQRRGQGRAVPEDPAWYVQHLRETDFSSRKSGCGEESFTDKVARYRKSLARDASRVKFVSAVALPVNEHELRDALVDERCKGVEDEYDWTKYRPSNNLPDGPASSHSDAFSPSQIAEATKRAGAHPSAAVDLQKLFASDSSGKPSTTTPSAADAKSGTDSGAAPALIAGATPQSEAVPRAGSLGNTTSRKQQAAAKNPRRASEYMFSSVEYYDETVDFDHSACPDDVTVIALDQDIIKRYDIECESTIKWTSLD